MLFPVGRSGWISGIVGLGEPRTGCAGAGAPALAGATLAGATLAGATLEGGTLAGGALAGPWPYPMLSGIRGGGGTEGGSGAIGFRGA
jgi:hypothetical protein